MADERIGGAFFELNADIGKFRANLFSAQGMAHAASTAIGTAFGNLASLAQQQLSKIASIPGQALAEYKANLASMAQVEARIRSTGGAAGITANEVAKIAEDLQGVTDYSHDATQQMQSMLLTFTNIKGDNFKQVTEAVLDMSAAFGEGDLTSSAVRVGKALQDPIEGATALRRVGVMLTESQMAVIKSMTEMGNIAGAQGIILKELNTEFGGSARAAREAGDGSSSLNHSWAELMETIGKSIFDQVKPLNKELANTIDLINKVAQGDIGSESRVRTIKRVSDELGVLNKNYRIMTGRDAQTNQDPRKKRLEDELLLLQKEQNSVLESLRLNELALSKKPDKIVLSSGLTGEQTTIYEREVNRRKQLTNDLAEAETSLRYIESQPVPQINLLDVASSGAVGARVLTDYELAVERVTKLKSEMSKLPQLVQPQLEPVINSQAAINAIDTMRDIELNIDSYKEALIKGLITPQEVIDSLGELAYTLGIVKKATFDKPEAKVDQKALDAIEADRIANLESLQNIDELHLKMMDDNYKKQQKKITDNLEWESIVRKDEVMAIDLQFQDIKKSTEKGILSVAEIANTAGVSAMNSFADAITNAVWASEGFGKIAENFGRAIGQMATELAAKAGIFYLLNLLLPGSGFVGMLGASWGMMTKSEHGNAFSDGNVMAFAHGGVVNSPTVFPMARGMGLMGEAGAEAVMPLKRNSRGDLGVTASQAPIHTHVYLDKRQIAEAVHTVDRLDRRRGL